MVLLDLILLYFWFILKFKTFPWRGARHLIHLYPKIYGLKKICKAPDTNRLEIFIYRKYTTTKLAVDNDHLISVVCILVGPALSTRIYDFNKYLDDVVLNDLFKK